MSPGEPSSSAPTVLVVAEVFPPAKGGSGRWLWELYRRLGTLKVQIAAGRADGAEGFDQAASIPIERMLLRFSSWGIRHPRSLLQYFQALSHLNRMIKRARPAALHAAKCLPEGLLVWAAAKRHRLPYCCYAHGEELTLARTSRELQGLTNRVLRGAERIVANSRFTERLLRDDWDVEPGRIVVMHPGVDITRFVPASPDPAVRARLGWQGRRVVLTVGALQRRKGQDMMIRALPRIREACPDVLYAIAGEGWERKYLDELVGEHRVESAVQFRGIPGDDELVACYQQCDLFALPNRQIGWDVEGFGIVLIEAQASGRPVLAGDSGGTPETLHAGESGIVLNCDAPEPLADAVIALLRDPNRRMAMGQQGRRWVDGRYDWDTLTRQAETLLMPR